MFWRLHTGAISRMQPVITSERMIKVMMMKIMAILAILASLFGCGNPEPQILDGPGMEYVDSDYRSVYANCLPFDDGRGFPYFAIAYLGNGDEGKENRQEYINRIFGELDKVALEKIQHYDFDGDKWYLIIPRYEDDAIIRYEGEEIIATHTGEAFTVKCNDDVTVNTFNVTDIDYLIQSDAYGVLKNTNENIWDITNIDDVLKEIGD